jgi:hypothetical protein
MKLKLLKRRSRFRVELRLCFDVMSYPGVDQPGGETTPTIRREQVRAVSIGGTDSSGVENLSEGWNAFIHTGPVPPTAVL